jgi:hypothetical protein
MDMATRPPSNRPIGMKLKAFTSIPNTPYIHHYPLDRMKSLIK